jgi:hypothetical protein
MYHRNFHYIPQRTKLNRTFSSTLPTGAYWVIGLRDIKQKSQTIRRNFPVLGNARYLLEMIREYLNEKRMISSFISNICLVLHLIDFAFPYRPGNSTIREYLNQMMIFSNK